MGLARARQLQICHKTTDFGTGRRPSFPLQFPILTHENLVYLRGELAVAKSKKKVVTVFLVCEETGDYNYAIRRRTGGEKLKLKKYSPRLRRHTVHVEKKK